LEKATEAETKAPIRSWLALSALCLAGLAIYISETSVSVGLPDMMGDLGVSVTAIAWVSTIYLLMVGMFVPVAPKLGEYFGYKKLFLFGFVLFGIGSLISFFSDSYTGVIIGRMVQGSGGCFIGPCMMKIASSIFTGKQLATALSLVAGSVGAGTALGPVIGGYLTQTFSWNALFSSNVLIVLLILPLAYIFVDEPDQTKKVKFDIPGIILLLFASCSLLLVLANGNAAWNTQGWTSVFSLTSFAVFSIAMIFFLLWETQTQSPLINLDMFKSIGFVISILCIFVLGFGFLGTQFVFPLFLENFLGLTRLNTGITFIPSGICLMVASVFIGRNLHKMNPKVPVIIGFISISISYFMGQRVSLQSSQSFFITMLMFRGLGIGLSLSTIINMGITTFKVELRGYATSAMVFFYLLGSSCGVALFETLQTKRTVYHAQLLSESSPANRPIYKKVQKGLKENIIRVGSRYSDSQGQSYQLIARHLQKVAYSGAVSDVMVIVTWVTLGSACALIVYESYRVISSRNRQ
jgi:MFS transporter, DHA2 family, multidrug resistance protein